MADQISPNALRAFDDNGDPAPGAKLIVYETGTTTPVTVYTDSAFSVAHASPIVADGNGYFAQIFYGGTIALKIVITDSEDVTLQTIDPAWQISTSGGAASLVTFTPTGDLVSTNVQDAIVEVQGNIGSNDGSTNANTLVTTAGSSSAYTVSAAATITAYAEGQKFLLRANHASTGASTLNVDSLGAKNLQKYDASGSLVALAAGDLPANSIFEATYDGTRFVLVSPAVGNSDLPGVLGLLDEDDMASDSATEAPSQKSTKAYVDAEVAAVGGVPTLGTRQSASGSNVTFSSIPSGTKVIRVMLVDVDKSSPTGSVQVTIGDAGGIEATGYDSSSSTIEGTPDADTSSTGFAIAGANGMDVLVTLSLEDASSNTWIASHSGNVGGVPVTGGGRKALSAELTQVRVETSSSFSDGTINIQYE